MKKPCFLLALAGVFLLMSASVVTAAPETTVIHGVSVDRWTTGSAASLINTADYDWYRGCSPTSAGMMMAYYDRNGYSQRNYRHLIPGGIAESTSFSVSAPLATTAINSLANYMGTTSGGATTFWYYTDNSPFYVANDTAHAGSSGLYGIWDFLVHRGYQNTSAGSEYSIYDQYISGYNGKSAGFTLAQYKTAIDAGRPVLIHTENHTMCGVGYGDGSTIYVMDTWNPGPHSMTWGGSYGGVSQVGVTFVGLNSSGAEANAVGGSCDAAYDDDGFLTGLSGGSTAGLAGNSLNATMAVTNFSDGGDGWATLKFFYSDEELIDAGITDESQLRMYWWDGAEWDFDGTGTLYTGAPQGVLGDYGIDVVNNYAWINTNHASEWSLAVVPEPSVWMMLFGMACTWLLWRRRSLVDL